MSVGSSVPLGVRHLTAATCIALALLGSGWGCGGSSSTRQGDSFPDATFGDAHGHVEASREGKDAVAGSNDGGKVIVRGAEPDGAAPHCTPDGGVVTLSTRGAAFDYGIAVDSTAVYYFGLASDGGAAEQDDLRRVNKDGTGDTELTLTIGQSVAQDDTYLYWCGYNPSFMVGVYRIAKAGGAADLLTPIQESQSLTTAVTPASVFWSASVHLDGSSVDEVLEAPIAGGAASVVAPPANGDLFEPQVAVDAEDVYWTGPNGTLYKRALAGGPTQLAPPSGVDAFDVDVDAIYYASGGSVYSLAKSGGSPVLLASSVGIPSLQHNATHVFIDVLFKSRILKVSKGGGPVETVVSGSTVGNAAFAVDADCIYWMGPGNGGMVPVSLYMAPN